MGHWVTLPETDQHVYISDGGKVLASRSAISATAAGRERVGKMRAKAAGVVRKALAGKRQPSKTAGPDQACEMARSQFKVAEKIRTGKMADAALKARYAREDALKAKLGGSKPAAIEHARAAAKAGEATVGAGKMVHQGYSKEGLAIFGPEGGKPESSRGESFPGRTTRAIEHARAAGPTLREQADAHRKLRARSYVSPEDAAKVAGDIRKLRGSQPKALAALKSMSPADRAYAIENVQARTKNLERLTEPKQKTATTPVEWVQRRLQLKANRAFLRRAAK
jgi:hypothetical protein